MPRHKATGGQGYYAVADGRNTGVFNSWDSCRDQVDGYSGASYKRFDTMRQAQEFASGGSGGYSSHGGSGRSRAEVYTDGCCHDNGRSGARGGIGVYWGDGSEHNVSRPLHGSKQTNNRAEIQAADTAIGQARDRGYSSVKVNTDSKFLVDAATKWMPKWERNDYKLATGGDVKNRSDFEGLRNTMDGMDVTWKHVPGHSGVHGNDMADKLANAGARKHRH